MIAKRFGTFQKWIDLKVEQEINSTKSAKSETRGALKQLTPKEKAKMKKVIDEMF